VQWGGGDLALRKLDRAFEVRDLGVSRLRIDPFMDPIRTDPRFRKAVECAGPLPFMDEEAPAET
jgi:hypothetical protein